MSAVDSLARWAERTQSLALEALEAFEIENRQTAIVHADELQLSESFKRTIHPLSRKPDQISDLRLRDWQRRFIAGV